MAMEKYNRVATNPRSLAVERHEEKVDGKTVAIADYKGRRETLKDGLYFRIVEVDYSVPQFTKSQRLRLNNLCERLDCYYFIDSNMEKDLLEKGMTKKIEIAVSPIEDNSAVKKLNQFFGITNYTNKKENAEKS